MRKADDTYSQLTARIQLHQEADTLRGVLHNPDLISSLNQEALSFLQRHRLVSYLLSGASEETRAWGKALRQKNTMHMMHLSAELIRIDQYLRKEHIPLLHLKGPVLSDYLYQNTGIKESRDIDLLVRPVDVNRASQLIEKKGYIRIYPNYQLTRAQARRFRHISHHFTYLHPQQHIMLELHWAFFTPGELYPLPMDEIFASKQAHIFFDHTLYMPDDQTMLFYLMLHGARHQWFRLGWLLDFKSLLHKRKTLYPLIHSQARQMHLEAVCLATLHLCRIFFQMDYPEEAGATKKGEKKQAISISKSAIQAIFLDPDKLYAQGMVKFKKIYYQLQLKKTLSYRYQVLMRVISNQSDWQLIPLPDSLFFLYIPLKPLLWLMAVARKKKIAKH